MIELKNLSKFKLQPLADPVDGNKKYNIQTIKSLRGIKQNSTNVHYNIRLWSIMNLVSNPYIIKVK